MEDKTITYIKGSEKQVVAIDTIKNEIAQLLQIDNLSFLIGAGCSSNIVDGKETGIPGMAALYSDFFEEYEDFEIAGKDTSALFDCNLEKMLEMIDAINVVNTISDVDKDIECKAKTVRNYLRNRVKAGMDSDEVKAIYKDFYARVSQRSRKAPISVFTTNYDLFSEMALDELGFPYNNGFSGTYRRKFTPASYNYVYVENMNLNKDVWEQVSSFYNLVKLHGSISWLRENGQVWERDCTSISDDDTVMIYPTPLKDRSTLMTPYSDLFRTMENRLMQKNSTLIVMGYSFGDDHINRVILNALAVPSFRLVVFGKSDNICKLQELNDSRISIIYSDGDEKIHYFKNIVNNVMPSMHPDIEEALQMAPVDDIMDTFLSGD